MFKPGVLVAVAADQIQITLAQVAVAEAHLH
jgi:hypothetical protein